ncbi:MAG: arylsulfatase, partial [Bacteroidaceae bacterium]|nr:arylsulfatase [Bacteroidaceae bacterium]
ANHTISVRTKERKYIPPSQGPAIISGPNMESEYSREPQLYDMSQPFEQKNMALEQPRVVFEMQSYIEKERAKGSTYKSPISK